MILRSYVILAVLILMCENTVAQILTPEERAKIVSRLDSTDSGIVLEALSQIQEYQITEAIPKLESNIWKQWPDYQYFFLRTMWLLHSPNTLAFAKAFVDSSNGTRFKNTPSITDSLRAKVDATEILMDLGDYSTVSYVFDELRRDSIVYDLAVDLLKSIVEKVPLYSDSAKKELLDLALQDATEQTRWRALTNLSQLYGGGMADILMRVAVNDPSGSNRVFALQKLITFEYPATRRLLYDRLRDEPVAVYRTLIVDTLLRRYGTPFDYNAVKEYQSWEQDPVGKSLTFKLLLVFQPPSPPSTATLLSLLDTLVSVKHEAMNLGWLSDANFVNELDNGLTNARKHLLRVDSVNCAKEVRTFQGKVNAQYQATAASDKKNQPRDKRFVTVEGWKFLYYNAQYILDRLPTSN
jgi:hypothetical protein